MSKKKAKPYILITVAFVLLTCCLSFLYLYTHLKLKDVYIAKYDLVGRTKLSEEILECKRVPEYYLNENVLINEEDIVGKYVKINTTIPKGSFIYESAIEDIDKAKDNLLVDLSENEVGYDLNANEIELNQAYLQKGMYVDIYLTINKEKVVSDLLINNVKIIGLYDINNSEIKDYDKTSILGKITFAIPQDYVIYLNKAKVIGKLNAVVGNHTYEDEKSIINTNTSVFEYLK